MKNAFLIGEFAELRNINANSLRYYEKLGILKPAYINPETSYRYYTSEQLATLDLIMLCVKLGIPLKEWEEYLDENGDLNVQNLLLQGRSLAQEQIRKINEDLSLIDHMLHKIETAKPGAENEGFYKKYFEERHVVISDCFNELPPPETFHQEVSNLYETAQKNGLFPVLPPGVFVRCHGNDQMDYRFFLEIINVKKQPNIITLPKGDYLCTPYAIENDIKPDKAILDTFGNERGSNIIISNLQQEKFSFTKKPCELQKYIP